MHACSASWPTSSSRGRSRATSRTSVSPCCVALVSCLAALRTSLALPVVLRFSLLLAHARRSVALGLDKSFLAADVPLPLQAVWWCPSRVRSRSWEALLYDCASIVPARARFVTRCDVRSLRQSQLKELTTKTGRNWRFMEPVTPTKDANSNAHFGTTALLGHHHSLPPAWRHTSRAH
jgi:hypothetical protein